MKESVWSKNFLLNMGVKDEDILLEKNSRNTKENAEYTAILLGNNISKKSLLITSANHMRRANLCFKKNDFLITCFPTDIINSEIKLSFDYLFLPKVSALETWENLLHELIGYIIYLILF